ncbi:pyridoxamine 5'-phosphate oxidase family protein [Candidatus Magnetaquicoccus inordinatus]|uniref:pyridoxamine 5'-phosphate oxidase family protein n=1 Tax=Candidatus Magnetaquicoccus inordinatus TaxID=2496818 RepID=UPI00102D1C3B|nr:pyridoxamine 5'-phosphate oxidase family protein [Candidatus Magnetaquicoccus inordinatus]
MGELYAEINPKVEEFIKQQHLFFVATAPVQGRINLSPKGIDTFRVIDARCVAFLNLTGSANETAAHLLSDNRITFMFCSFTAQPWIVRLYGQGRVYHARDSEWSHWLAHFPDLPGKRQVIVADIDLVHSSCGFGVPLMDFQGERQQMLRWAEKKGEEGIRRYWEENNLLSLDGVPTQILP